jgi:serine protease Do
MIRSHRLSLCLALVVFLSRAGEIQAQFKSADSTYTRANPTFLKAFRDVVAKPSESTVRIQCNGKDAALGMVIGPDGWILTKANDLKGDLTVKLRDGKTYEARWVGTHEQHDLALLKIEATGLKPIEFSDSKQVGVGNWLACPGTGNDPVAIGVVSVATRAIPKGSMNFPAPDLNKAGYLGVSLTPGDGHPLIDQVMPETPAAKIGLKQKDLILALNGANMTEQDQFIKEIAKFKPGDTVTLKVRRGDAELELKPKLGTRPPNRGDQQDHMGSELSARRGGYATILQHDSVIKPADCGGPIVDIHGHVIGINICRAGRTESWAVPSEVIQPILFDLMAGKLPPRIAVAKLTLEQQMAAARKSLKKAEEEKATAEKKLTDLKTALAKLEADVKIAESKAAEAKAAEAKAAEAKAAQAKAAQAAKDAAQPKPMPAANPPKKDDEAMTQADKVVSLIQERLKLMKDVAGAKWQAKKTDADPAREKELLDQLVAHGEKMGLPADLVRRFFTAQFDAAKQVQQSYFDRYRKENLELKNVRDLQKDLRPKLDQLSQELLAAFAKLQPHLANPAVQQRLRDRAAAVLAGEGITDAIRTRALEPLIKR